MSRALVLLAGLAACASVAPEEMEPGEWQFVVTVRQSDEPKATTVTETRCMTKSELEEIPDLDFPECKYTRNERTAGSHTWHRVCAGAPIEYTGSRRWTRTTSEFETNLKIENLETISRFSGRRVGACRK
jgi:hypothetical protein